MAFQQIQSFASSLVPQRRSLGHYAPLNSSNDPAIELNDVENNGSQGEPARPEGLISRIFSVRTILVAVCLLVSFSLGYLTKSTATQWQPGHKFDPPPPVSASPEDNEDYFFHPPLKGERTPQVAEYNAKITNEDVVSTLSKIQSPITPLFIPFTRNRYMLRQTVLSWIAIGWPRDQIIIIDNTGTMDANPKGLLSKDNPFSLDYDLYRSQYGVSILCTPTLLTFSQLQNYMLAMAMSKNWAYYLWSHQDVAALSDETVEPYQSMYERLLLSIEALSATMGQDAPSGKRWGARFYGFDWLTLINVDAVRNVGMWDPFIPYYNTDCDWYERSRMSGHPIDEESIGDIFDLAAHVQDPETRFFPPANSSGEDAGPNSPRYQALKAELKSLMDKKNDGKNGDHRNEWQNEQTGGKGEPWTYNPDGFQGAWWALASAGRQIYADKWGTGACGLINAGKKLSDAWSR